jgi:hypothetical protein
MKSEYDFKQGVRRKFFKPDAILQVPVYLDPEVLEFLMATAEEKGVAVDEIANDLLKRDIGIIKTTRGRAAPYAFSSLA